MLGVSQARRRATSREAALRAYRAPRVDMLIHFLVRDEPHVGRCQSGLFTSANAPKLSASRSRCRSRSCRAAARSATLWGQVRPGTGSQTYRLRYTRGGAWRWLGGTPGDDRARLLHVEGAACRSGRACSAVARVDVSAAVGSASAPRVEHDAPRRRAIGTQAQRSIANAR